MKGKVFSDDELGVLEQVIELLTIRMELDYTGEEDVDWKEERETLVSILNLLCTEQLCSYIGVDSTKRKLWGWSEGGHGITEPNLARAQGGTTMQYVT